jgi:hypothetical protein
MSEGACRAARDTPPHFAHGPGPGAKCSTCARRVPRWSRRPACRCVRDKMGGPGMQTCVRRAWLWARVRDVGRCHLIFVWLRGLWTGSGRLDRPCVLEREVSKTFDSSQGDSYFGV